MPPQDYPATQRFFDGPFAAQSAGALPCAEVRIYAQGLGAAGLALIEET